MIRRGHPESVHSRPRFLTGTLILLLIGFVSEPTWGQQFENAKLTASDANREDWFGCSVALSYDTALIGAHRDDDNSDTSGSAYVYRYHSPSGKWQEEAKLLASDGEAGDWFGYSVALSGDTALIGSPRDNDNGGASGSAYIFEYDSASGTWHEKAKLLASDGAGTDYFGWSVVLLGNRALIGAKGNNGQGAAYVFEYDTSSGTWNQAAKLVATDGSGNDQFGYSVALSGNRAVVGAPHVVWNATDPGQAYVFVYDPNSGTWYEEAKLVAADGARGDKFGIAVGISGDIVIIGACDDDDRGRDSGSAYVFQYDSVSGTWYEESKLLASDGAVEDYFGSSIALSEELAVIGSPLDDYYRAGNSGSAYVFRRDSASGQWNEETKLRASDDKPAVRLGNSAMFSGDRVLLGAYFDDEIDEDAGAAYVYDFASVLSLDVKCNGQDQNVNIGVGEPATVTIDIRNGYHPGFEGDLWVLAVTPFSLWNVWTFGPALNPHWYPHIGNVYYTGPGITHGATVLDSIVPTGTYSVYLAVDSIPNGLLNLSAIRDCDVVDFTVQ